ncbi:MAG: hypothetical protein M5T61_03040 [Acidimicrobiia bacterium]|nr:hypothetical protein [Acidimicrobiia bacterium]
MARHLRTTAIAAAAALLLIAAGCGGGSDSPGSTDLERATRDFAVNIFSGGEGAYDYLSQECRDQVRAPSGTLHWLW